MKSILKNLFVRKRFLKKPKNGIVKPLRANYCFIGGDIKMFFLNYAFCSCCAQYLVGGEKKCPFCNYIIDWSDVPLKVDVNDVL